MGCRVRPRPVACVPLLALERLVGSHGTSRFRNTARRLPQGHDRTMRYVRGTPAAERPIARRWHATLIRAAAIGRLLSGSRSASPATTGVRIGFSGIKQDAPAYRWACVFMHAFCAGAGLRDPLQVYASLENENVLSRVRKRNQTPIQHPTAASSGRSCGNRSSRSSRLWSEARLDNRAFSPGLDSLQPEHTRAPPPKERRSA
jgi:hypothetical protein